MKLPRHAWYDDDDGSKALVHKQTKKHLKKVARIKSMYDKKVSRIKHCQGHNGPRN